ncbi:MAG: hypothetical protein HC767_10895 [Akkermansiaceae bacterium]|nr:hypothetical protein [Akkermansiaceae bacterium]
MSKEGTMGLHESIDVADFICDLQALSDADDVDKENALSTLPRSFSKKSGAGTQNHSCPMPAIPIT